MSDTSKKSAERFVADRMNTKDDTLELAADHDVEMAAMIPAAVMNVAKKVSAFLGEHQVPHAVAGGMALSAHGHARMTMTVDVLVSSSAVTTIALLGKTSPISGFLSGVSVGVDGINVCFLLLGRGLRSNDFDSGLRLAALPVVSIEVLILMKLGADRMQDIADVVQLLKLGNVPVAKVRERLSESVGRHFEHAIEIAEAETAGDVKKARRLFLDRRRSDGR